MAQSRNDCRFEALRALGYEGQINDMLFAWLVDNVFFYQPKTLPDAWYFMLVERFVNRNPERFDRNQWWYDLLGGLGYTGAISDRETAFWCVGGGILPPPPGGGDQRITDIGDDRVTDIADNRVTASPAILLSTSTS